MEALNGMASVWNSNLPRQINYTLEVVHDLVYLGSRISDSHNTVTQRKNSPYKEGEWAVTTPTMVGFLCKQLLYLTFVA